VGLGAAGLGAIALMAVFFQGVSEAEAEIVAKKAQAARIMAAPVVRVCQGGAFVRSVDGRLHVADHRQGGWARDGAPLDSICQASAG
jgi:hypothetical protein